MYTDHLKNAILRTLAYAEVFEYPMTLAEIHRYLIGVPAAIREVEQSLRLELEPAGQASLSGGLYTLPGRETLVELRTRRSITARRLWPGAVRFGILIARLPFVRMVAVTGALAVNNVDPQADIDYLVITAPGRLWLCRALIIAVVRMAAQTGLRLCPNYIISESALAIPNPALYPAHELAQMVPIAGFTTYQRIRRINSWADCYLPNAAGAPPEHHVTPRESSHQIGRSLVETLLEFPVWERIELWEMQRKIHKFALQYPHPVESTFSRDWCKGHFDAHGQRTIKSYRERLTALGLSAEV